MKILKISVKNTLALKSLFPAPGNPPLKGDVACMHEKKQEYRRFFLKKLQLFPGRSQDVSGRSPIVPSELGTLKHDFRTIFRRRDSGR